MSFENDSLQLTRTIAPFDGIMEKKIRADRNPTKKGRDFLTPADRSERMSRIRSQGTKCEKEFGRVLRRAGLRYRGQRKDLPGRPDFAMVEAKVAVFVDGAFWHGRDLRAKGDRLDDHWLEKIRGNVRRDRRNDRELRAKGWSVVRIWEKDVFRRSDWCVARVKRAMKRRMSK